MENDEFLSVLAEVMCGNGKKTSVMDELYRIADDELYSCLEKNEFPATSELVERINLLLQYINAFSLYPNLADCEVIALYGQYTNCLLKNIETELVGKYCDVFKKYKIQIPLLVMNSDAETIEIVNSSFNKILIDERKLEILLSRIQKSHIALDKLVKFIVIKQPLKNINKCFILDNQYGTLTELYDELIVVKLYQGTVNNLNKLSPDVLNSLDYFVKTGRDVKSENQYGNSCFKILNQLKFDEICKNKKARIAFDEIYKYSICPLKVYYEKNIKTCNEILNYMKIDSAMGEDSVLDSFSNEMSKKLAGYKDAEANVYSVLQRFEEEINKIDLQYEEISSDTTLTKHIKNCLFSYYFAIADIDPQEGNTCLRKILNYNYENREIVLAYSESIRKGRSTFQLNNITYVNSWEYAKMLLQFAQSDELNNDIEYWLNWLNPDQFTTANEWYYWALYKKDKDILIKAAQMGSDKAKKKLEEIGENKILLSLLHPDTCIKKGTEEIAKGKDEIVSINDKKMVYLKIAAILGENEAIQMIADTIYQNTIWYTFSIQGKPLPDESDAALKKSCKTLFNLYEKLIYEKVDEKKNKEHAAVIYFCLDEKYSNISEYLYPLSSSTARYIKGYMKEYAKYGAKDLDKALEYYNKVDDYEIPAAKDARNRVKEKIRKRNNKNDYNANKDYSRSTSSEGTGYYETYCFNPCTKIYMADGSFQSVKELKINDWVLAYDHFEGKLVKEKIIANVHDNLEPKKSKCIELTFENGNKLEIVKSHALFDVTENQYINIEPENVNGYLGHYFAAIDNGNVVKNKLVGCVVTEKETRFYAPITRYHLNLFAEGLLTMPPTLLTVNLFNFKKEMQYDVSKLEKFGLTPYEEISDIVSKEEYEELPCKYLAAVLATNNCTIEDFKHAIKLYREQQKYM